jgi:hypothetical protein
VHILSPFGNELIKHKLIEVDAMHEIKIRVLHTLLLMTKFGKAEKIGCSDFLFWIVRFWQFQTQTEEGAKI